MEESQDYRTELKILNSYRETSRIFGVYMGMFDWDAGALVYIVDPDENYNTATPPGYWEHVSRKKLERFLNWDETDMLYDIGHTSQYGWVCTAGVPILTKEGSVCGFVLADITLGGLIDSMRSFVLRFTLAILLFTLLIAFFSARRFRKALIKPINAIAAAAQQYMEDKDYATPGTDHFASLNIRTGDEIENLSLIMADMERYLGEFEASLTAATAERERITTELNLAASIQAHMLPSTFPAFPEHREFEVFAAMNPAKEVGGDFYDFFLVDDDHLALVIADVSGKGIPAALFMMASRTMIKGTALTGMDPAAVLERVNAQLSENNPDYMFVTVWLGVLELSTGKLVWSDAGHERLFICRNGAWECLPKKGGFALAAIEPELMDPKLGAPFHNQELILQSGDAVFQYTDGVTEAMKADREQFGMERLAEALRSAPDTAPEALLDHVRGSLDAFVCGAPQFDDITMLSLQYKGKDRHEKQ